MLMQLQLYVKKQIKSSDFNNYLLFYLIIFIIYIYNHNFCMLIILYIGDHMKDFKIIDEVEYNGRKYYKVSLDNEEYIFKKVHADDYKLVDYKEFSKIFDKKNKCKSLNKIIK